MVNISTGSVRICWHDVKDMIVWCDVVFLHYLRLLRQRVRAATRTKKL